MVRQIAHHGMVAKSPPSSPSGGREPEPPLQPASPSAEPRATGGASPTARELAARLEQLSARSPTGRLTTALSNAADSPPQDLPANTEARLEALALQTATVVTRGAGAVHRQLELKAVAPAPSGKLTLKKAQPVAEAVDADTQQLAEEARQARAGALASQPAGDLVVDVMASPQRTRSMAEEANDLFSDEDEEQAAVGSIVELGRSSDPKVQQLMDLGADEAQARSALEQTNGDVKAASANFFASGADRLEEQLAALGWAEGGDAVPEEEFLCEYDCGFKGSFAAVEEHEATCAAAAAAAPAAQLAPAAALTQSRTPDKPKQPPQTDAAATTETPKNTKKNKKKKKSPTAAVAAAVAVDQEPPRKARILKAPTEELSNLDKKKGIVRVCRFGLECTREGCWFQHPEGYVAPPPGSDDVRGALRRAEQKQKALEAPPEPEPQPEVAADLRQGGVLQVNLKSGERIAVGKKGAAAVAAPGTGKKKGKKVKPCRDGADCTVQNCQFGHPAGWTGAGGRNRAPKPGAGGAKDQNNAAKKTEVTLATVEQFICEWVNEAGGEVELTAAAAALGKHQGYAAAAKKGTRQDTVEKAILRIVETSTLFETGRANAAAGGGGGGGGGNRTRKPRGGNRR